MSKYLIETLCQSKLIYVVECEDIEDAKSLVESNNAIELTGSNLKEVIFTSRKIDDKEFIKIFDENLSDLKTLEINQKLQFVNKVDKDTWEFS